MKRERNTGQIDNWIKTKKKEDKIAKEELVLDYINIQLSSENSSTSVSHDLSESDVNSTQSPNARTTNSSPNTKFRKAGTSLINVFIQNHKKTKMRPQKKSFTIKKKDMKEKIKEIEANLI